MDRKWLENNLNAGRSIEAIARETGLGASTVGYWVKKHGLQSQHAAKHASKGGIARQVLEALIAEGLSSREIAERIGVSRTTVGHWLERHGLETLRGKTKRTIREALAVSGPQPEIEAHCGRHGWTKFVRRAGGYRCHKCRSEAVTARRRVVKSILVEEAGGACVACGYDRCLAALQFHHVDPAAKEFSIAQRGVARSIARARAEAKKCVLLCANCHVEEEQRVANLAALRSSAQDLTGR